MKYLGGYSSRSRFFVRLFIVDVSVPSFGRCENEIAASYCTPIHLGKVVRFVVLLQTASVLEGLAAKPARDQPVLVWRSLVFVICVDEVRGATSGCG